MVRKILIWIDDSSYLQYCISKYIQEKIDCEIYAIADVNKYGKEFLQHQSTVKLEKVWFYRDHLPPKNKKPDLNYLIEFEKKYKINLWGIAYSERLFYNYITYYKPSKNEILSILELECKLFENIFNESKPEFLLIKNTDNQQNTLLFELAKSYNIKILTFASAKLANLSHISQDADKIDESNIEAAKESKIQIEYDNYLNLHDPLGQDTKKKSIEMPTMKKRRSLFLRYLTNYNDSYFKNYFANYGKHPVNFITKNILLICKKYYRERFLDRHAERKIDYEKFVYFPLHVEPERSILISAPYYSDQINAITNISKALPVGYYLLVKEHSSMALMLWRKISFYKEIIKLPNVKLIHHSIDPKELLKKCQLVITVAGTVGLEALFFNKPVIVMADTIFSSLPSVFRLKSFEDLPKLIKKTLSLKPHDKGRNALIHLLEKEGIPIDMIDLQHDVMSYIGGQGLTEFISPKESDFQKFIDAHKTELDLLAERHISKMNLYDDGRVIVGKKRDTMRNST